MNPLMRSRPQAIPAVSPDGCRVALHPVTLAGVQAAIRTFVLAGAESLLLSLWAVSDSVALEMMTAFYTGLRKALGRGETLLQT